MKRFIHLISALTVVSLALAACGGGAAQQTEPPATEAPTEAATEAPTEAATEAATEPPAVVPVDLAGPPMELGSKYVYVDGTVLIAVPGGPFIMGYNFADNPEREVTVGDFWIYSTKVTNQQYALCVLTGKCTPPDPKNATTYGDGRFINYPVTGVTHGQAAEYCAFVKGRLPTEAEWEKTARGPEGNIWPWGNSAPNCSLLNYVFCKGRTTHVNEYPDGKSYYEAWDMSGNAREWVADWYSPTYNIENPVADPLGPEFGEKRSVRGSSYQDSANATIAAHRFSLEPDKNLPDLGFRCVVEDPTAFAPWCELIGYAGTGPDGSEANCVPQVKCNDVDITVIPECNQQTFTGFAIVTFEMSNNPPDGWTYDAAGCSPIPGEQTPTKDKYLCTPPGPVGPATAQGSCIDTVSCVSTCPMHYNKVGDTCVWDGSGTSGTECLPGSTYDPLLQCCTSIPGVGTDFGLCPAGYYPLNGVCVPNPQSIPPPLSEPIVIPNCSPPPTDPGDDDDDGDDDDTPGGCIPIQCDYGGIFDPQTCTCRYP
jgi:formylglycine-generating enzyme required for sulfatase activity